MAIQCEIRLSAEEYKKELSIRAASKKALKEAERLIEKEKKRAAAKKKRETAKQKRAAAGSKLFSPFIKEKRDKKKCNEPKGTDNGNIS